MLLCEVLLAGSSAVVRAVRVGGGAGGGISWRVLACRGGASRQSRVLGARGASRRGGDGPPFLSHVVAIPSTPGRAQASAASGTPSTRVHVVTALSAHSTDCSPKIRAD